MKDDSVRLKESVCVQFCLWSISGNPLSLMDTTVILRSLKQACLWVSSVGRGRPPGDASAVRTPQWVPRGAAGAGPWGPRGACEGRFCQGPVAKAPGQRGCGGLGLEEGRGWAGLRAEILVSFHNEKRVFFKQQSPKESLIQMGKSISFRET